MEENVLSKIQAAFIALCVGERVSAWSRMHVCVCEGFNTHVHVCMFVPVFRCASACLCLGMSGVCAVKEKGNWPGDGDTGL